MEDSVLSERISNVLDKVEDLTSEVTKLLDKHQEVTTDVAVIKNQMLNHSNDDIKQFGEIKKKHVWYDKVIIAALVFASTELFGIVVYMIFRK